MITLDFETEAIVGNPIMFPPKPVGLAVTYDNMDTMYYTGDMRHVFGNAVESGEDLLFHNAPFDCRVAEEHLGIPMPKWQQIHDTQYLVFLKDPHARSLSLKPSADRYLDMPPEEQDLLKEWILANVPKATEKTWGAFICEAPAEIVAPYAKGDTIRTRKLFDYLHPILPREPYDRERQLMPIMVATTRRGVRVNRTALDTMLGLCTAAQATCEQRIGAYLGAPGLNPHSGTELAAALANADQMTEWALTPTGKRSTARPNLMAGIRDKELLDMLVYTAAMQTIIGTFMEPWLDKSAADGRLHPNWNQTRHDHGTGGFKGTRTGRLSSDDPNFTNMPNPFDYPIPQGLVPLPSLREYILPEEGHIWLKRDWSGQEMRILAYYENGALASAYRENPDLDAHAMVKDIIHDLTAQDFPRKFVKETGFGMIYGMGVPGLAKKIGCDIQTSRDLQSSYHMALPGVAELQKGTKNRGRSGGYITTMGGRHYYAEEPKIIKGAYRSFEYKLTNYLIQGGAADQCKQCIIDWDITKPSNDMLIGPVHDELNISVPERAAKNSMAHLRACMEQDFIDIPMRSEGFIGSSWGKLTEYID